MRLLDDEPEALLSTLCASPAAALRDMLEEEVARRTKKWMMRTRTGGGRTRRKSISQKVKKWRVQKVLVFPTQNGSSLQSDREIWIRVDLVLWFVTVELLTFSFNFLHFKDW